MVMRKTLWFLGFVIVGLQRNALAQFTSDQNAAGLPSREQMQLETKNARMRLGPLRLQPVLSLRNIGFTGGVIGTTGVQPPDFGASVGGGARAIVPFGRDVFFRVSAIPEYSWSRRLVQHRVFGGVGDASALFLFNRLSAQARVIPARTVSPFSTEDQRSVVVQRFDTSGRIEVRLLQRLSLFVAHQNARPRFRVTAEDRLRGTNFDQLDRNDSADGAGVFYQFRSFLSVSAGFERSQSRFIHGASADNHTNAENVSVSYGRPRTSARISLGASRGEADNGASFQHFSTGTGSYLLSRRLANLWTVDVSGSRRLQYSLFQGTPYYFETRNGAAIAIPIRRRFAVRMMGEVGSNSYPQPTAASLQTVRRIDQVLTYGGGLGVAVYRNAALVTMATRTRYNSNLPGFDRSVVTVTTNLNYLIRIPFGLSTSRDFFQ